MRNFVIIDNGYINGTASTPFGADTNANEIEQILCHQPSAPEGFVYRLRADTLEWELHELPIIPPEDEEATTEDYEAALTEVGV